MKACKDIDFLDSYWKEAKNIASRVENELPMNIGDKRKPFYKKDGAKLFIVNFSELDSWNPGDLIYSISGKSKTLEALADKISRMIYRGRADSVKPMVESICRDNFKKLTKKNSHPQLKGEFLGYGHFRWNNQAYTLNKKEITHLKKYFKI